MNIIFLDQSIDKYLFGFECLIHVFMVQYIWDFEWALRFSLSYFVSSTRVVHRCIYANPEHINLQVDNTRYMKDGKIWQRLVNDGESFQIF